MNTLEMPEILTSPLTQGFECPFCNDGGGGVMHLWLVKSANHYFLSCDECDHTVDTDTPISEWHRDFFDGYLTKLGFEPPQDFGNIKRVLDHKLFGVNEEEFRILMNKAWNRPKKFWIPFIFGFDVKMGETVGLSNGNIVRIFINQRISQIVDALPYP